jgi:hypothetical protein
MNPLNTMRVIPSLLAGLSRNTILSIGFIKLLLVWRWVLWLQGQVLGSMIPHALQSSAPLALSVAMIGAPIGAETLAVCLADLA